MYWDLFELVDRIRKETCLLDNPIGSSIPTNRGPWDEGVVRHGTIHASDVVMVIAKDTMDVSEENHGD